MKTRFSAFRRILSVVLALTLVFGLVPNLATTARGAESDLRIFSNKLADPSTMDWERFFGPDVMHTEYAGGVWTDKSVYKEASRELPGITLTDDNNFLISMSAIASNLSITGHTTAPTDTMLVLDLSGSMISTYEVGTIRQQSYGNNNRYTTVNGRDASLVKAMVDATNAAIAQLMTQNPNNRVGVVLFSGNTSTNQAATTSTATVVLPLGRYKGVSNGTELEYLQMNAEYEEDVALYEYISTGWNSGYWRATGETVDYIDTDEDVSVSTKEGLLTDTNTEVAVKSKTVVGGTYTQNGLYQALNEFNTVTDTRVPDGKVQAGADRVPAIVLMTDGAPTIATSSYSAVGTSNTGNGGSENDMITFLTQLTAAYVRGAVANKYTEPEADEQKVLFLTLGLGTSNSTGATNTLYPAGTTDDVAKAWETYLAQRDNSTREYDLGDYERDITRRSLVTAMNYVDKYYYADDADSLITSFEQIVSEIELKAESYATLIESTGADFSGYVTFEDELGELMEVSDMKGILIGDKLYTGEELAKGMTEGNLGTPQRPNGKGDELIRTVKERIPGTDTTAAQQLVNNAYLDQQLYWENANNWSNYIGWYAKADGTYAGFWDKDSGYTNAPADALYANKSYGYLGENQDSDMMHVVVMVRTNLQTLHQTVLFKIPAALLPTVTYNITLDEENPDTVKEFTRDSAQPMQVVFEVGLRSDINSVNLEEKIAAHIAAGGHIHRNDDGSVTLYTNEWGMNNDTDKDGYPDYNEALTAQVAVSHFHPALDNSRYYFTEDTLVLDASGDPVTTAARPVDTDSDPDNGTGYHHMRYVYSRTGRQAVQMPISAVTLTEKAQRNDQGQWYIPAGTIYQELTRFRTEKASNTTKTLNYSDYPAVYENGGKQDVYNFLGNNGSITVAPATGISLTKAVEDGLSADGPYTFEIALSGVPAGATVAPMLTDADGAPLAKVTMSAYENGKFTVTMPANVQAYITGIPSGTTVTVTEQITGDYKITGAQVGGTDAVITGSSVSLTVPAYDKDNPQKLTVPVSFTNAPNSYGNLIIEKEVAHDLAADPEALASKVFTFLVKLEGQRIVPGTSSFTTSEGTVTVGADSTFTVELKNEESIAIYNIPEGTTYTVTEIQIPDGFKLDNINTDATATAATGSIVKDQAARVEFVNRYPDDFVPVQIPVQLDVTKILGGETGNYTKNEDFYFTLQMLLPDGSYPSIKTNTGSDYLLVKAGSTAQAAYTLIFDQIGTYYFRVVEVRPSQADATLSDTPGMSYSTMRALFRVVVTDDDMDGVLEIAVQEEANVTATPAYTDNDHEKVTGITVAAEFTNIYALDSTNTTLNVHKVLNNETGVVKSTTDFHFTLTPVDENGVAIPGAQIQTVTTSALGDATFNLVFETAGTFYYKVKEVIPAEAQLDAESGKYVLSGMHYDPAEYLFTVVVAPSTTDDTLVVTSRTLENLITQTPVAEANGSYTALFENDYILTGTSAYIPQTKVLQGRAPYENESFQSYLVRTDAAFNELTDNDRWVAWYVMWPGRTANIKLDFTKAGIYYYKLTEEIPAGDTDGITYDTSVYHITVTVTDNGTGGLEAQTVIHKLGQAAAVTKAEFVNTYTVTGEEQIVLSGLKNLNGRRMAAGEFEFVLYDEDGDPLDTVRNLADGSFTFKTLTFTPADLGENNAPKVHTFTVKETANGLGGMDYDETVYTVKVTVAHENGALTVSQEMLKGETPYTGDIVFNNTYSADEVTVKLHGSKILTGDWSAVADKGFAFRLYQADANFQITDRTYEEVRIANGDYTNGTASFFFEKTYVDTQEGFYYFVLHEDTSAAAGGIGYDAGEYHITVNVSDPGNGQLVAMVSMYRPGVGNIAIDTTLGGPVAVFTNGYFVEPTQITLEGTKKLTGRDMDADEFYFLVLDNGAFVTYGTNTAAADGEASAITFQPITYYAPGKYTYTVVEYNNDLGGVTYPDTAYTVVVDVTDNGDGTLTAALDTANSDTIEFVNTYSVTAKDLYLTGTKTLTGDWSAVDAANQIFTFHILDGTTVKSVGSSAAPVNGSAQITFQKLTFTEAGVHTYKIVEVDEEKGGITYSDKEYTLVVTVVDNGDGTLTVSYTVDGVADGDITFENSYAVKETSLVLNATKKYDKSLAENKFKFTLKGSIGTQPVDQQKENDDNGQITFDKLTFTEAGVYTFRVAEVKELLGFIRYDSTQYEVVVTVEDNGVGELVASYTVNQVRNGDITFVNSYILDGKGNLVLEGTKTLTGRDMADGEFRFGLYDAEGKLVAEAVNVGGKFTLKLEGLGKDYVGKKLNYTVREILPTDSTGKAQPVYNGVTYDQTAYKVEVTVTDNGTGGVDVAHKLIDAGSISFKNAYAPDFTVSKTQTVGTGAAIATQTEVKAGDTVTYTITVKNTGAGALMGITVSDKIPAGLVLKAGSISGNGTEKDGVITWNVEALAAGEAVGLTFQVVVPQVNEKTVWKNVAAAAHSTPGNDPELPSNDVELVEYVVEIPETGDPTDVTLLLALMAISGCAMAALILTGKKKEQNA